MTLDPLQQLTSDVLAVRILLGQLIVRIAAASDDPQPVMDIMRDGALGTADIAKLRDLPDELEEEMREHLRGSIERFFAAMRIERGKGS